jgi:cytochrome c-type biogenesis protein CcsB
MELMGVLTIIFAFSIGFATLIESRTSTEAAWVAVYGHTWFELLLFLLGFNLIGNLINFRMFTIRKFTVLMFHLGFIFILLGAGVTRFIGYEGIMSIREGEQTDKYISLESYINVDIKEGNSVESDSKRVRFAENTNQNYSYSGGVDENIRIELKNYIPNAVELIQDSPEGVPIMSVAISDALSRSDVTLHSGEIFEKHGQLFKLNVKDQDSMAIHFISNQDILLLQSPFDIILKQMMTGSTDTIPFGTLVEFRSGQIYETGGIRMVLKDYREKGQILYRSSTDPSVSYYDILNFSITQGSENKELFVRGKKGFEMRPDSINIGNASVKLAYGAKEMKLPFELKLKDFVLERYEGSNSPSSYSSIVEVIDEDTQFEYDIHMNHILNHKGYRLYQSSYDKNDEKGTVLSVNHDLPGTVVTYVGYFLMILGMLLSLFNPQSRFRALNRRIRDLNIERRSLSTILIILFVGVGFSANAQVEEYNIKTYPDEIHAKEFGKIWVQDHKGRYEPMNTLTSEVVRKLTRKVEFGGLSHEQVFLGIMVDPVNWSEAKVLRVGEKSVREMLGTDEKYVSYADLLDVDNNSYKLKPFVEAAFVKDPSKRNRFDKEVLKLDERMNIFYMLATSQFMRVLPKTDPNDLNWVSGLEPDFSSNQEDSVFVKNILPLYFGAVRDGISAGDYTQAGEYLKGIYSFQLKYGSEGVQNENLKNVEILYNESNIFNRISRLYSMVGFILLIMLFISVIKPRLEFKWVNRILAALIIVGFFGHTFGLGLRWYISGHAPWSNGYESVIYVAWACVLAGIIFLRKSYVALAGTAVVASLALMVAHLSWMDPEITPLVPVLKSYWLTIHVSVITASYGFLALGAILGLFNLTVYIFKRKGNAKRLDNTIQALSHINEMTLIIGLYLLTIGTFLGGIWANESWGRYWGWDPKETWSLVTILVYSFVVHMRMIPGLNNKYLFNLLSLISYGSVMMTYFGVNYLLQGLHSYGKGEPAPMPDIVWYTLGVILILAIFAGIKKQKYADSES